MSAPPWARATDTGVIVNIKAVPRAKRTQAVGIYDGRLRVQIAAIPHKGQSNAALFKYLAEQTGVRPKAVSMTRGSSGANKVVEITGDPSAILAKLTELHQRIS